MKKLEQIRKALDASTIDYNVSEEIMNLLFANSQTVLDKIRTEIDYLPKLYPFADHIDSYVKDTDVLAIIDKYRNQ